MSNPIPAIFPYQKIPDGRIFPIIPLVLHHEKRVAEAAALIDSGASTSIFRPEIAEYLKIEVEKGKTIELNGIGGWIRGYLHQLDIELAGKQFKCPIIFSYEYTVSLSLLGREGFFEKFVIIFDEKNKTVRLE